jgi:hypothetical protein
MRRGYIICLREIAAFFIVVCAMNSTALPNLTPYEPSGWSDKIVVARTTDTTTDSTGLTTADTLYVNWAIINNGTAATASTFYTALYVDGVYQTDWSTPPPLNAGFYTFITNYSIGSLSAGTHSIEIITDVTGVITESNETDNSYTKTITVSNPNLPNLTPYEPSGWSDKIVVARSTGTTADSTGLTTADMLYVNWAVINNGTAATASTFYTALYVDGVYQIDWSTPPPLDASFYTFIANYSIGSLSAGTHSIEIITDVTGVITESNETDNSYTKTITVSNPSLPNLTPYEPSGWSDKIVVARTTGTTTDSTGLTTADMLYVNWAVINNGTAATASTFYTALYVDGVYQTNWSTPPPLAAGFYTFITNYSVGSLSAGTHSIEIVTDVTGVITESNETDNSYTKTITISVANLPAPTLNNPANGSTGQFAIPTFGWSQITGASSYRIMVASNAADLPSDPAASNGGPSIVINATSTNPSFTPSILLNADATYYWEVHARSATQYGTWSSTNSFTTSPSASGLTIIPTFDSTITTDPQAATIEATIESAIAVYQSKFSNPITVSIVFQEMTNGLGQSTKYIASVSYADYRAALASAATTPDDALSLVYLPMSAGNPVNSNQNITLCLPLARALGFNANPPSGKPDGTIGLKTSIMNLSSAQTNLTNYSLFAAVSHEIDEVLGLGSALNGSNNGDMAPTGAVYPEDLFRYDQNGVRCFTTALGAISYFSLDGATDLARFNQYDGGTDEHGNPVHADFGDWYSPGGQTPQVQDAFQTPGATPVLGVELRVLDAIGYNLVTPVPTLMFQTITCSAGTITFTWTAVPGRNYQVQDATNSLQTMWNNLGSAVSATGSFLSFSDSIGPDHQKFYRVVLLSTSAPNLTRNKSQLLFGPISTGTNYLRPLYP